MGRIAPKILIARGQAIIEKNKGCHNHSALLDTPLLHLCVEILLSTKLKAWGFSLMEILLTTLYWNHQSHDKFKNNKKIVDELSQYRH